MNKKFICPCGLTCCDCLFYKEEIYKTAQKLQDLIMANGLDKFLIGNSSEKFWGILGDHMDIDDDLISEKIGSKFEVFKLMPEFMKVLDGIIKLQCKTTCKESDGCSIGGDTNECKVLKCIKSKEYDGCWECDTYETCDKLTFLKRGYGDTIEGNFKIINEKGMDSVVSRGNEYYAWQRKSNSQNKK